MRTIRSERGLALIGVIIVTALLMSLAVTLGLSVNADTQLRGAFSTSVSGFYAAEAGLNKGMGDYKNIFLDFGIPNGADFDEQIFSINGRETVYQLNPSASMQTNCTGGETPPCPANVTIPEGEIFGGLNAIQYNYTVNSAAVHGQDTQAAVGAEFLVGYIPLFQFVAFYANDLEIAPGPVMNLNGRVHTNSDLYLGGGNGPLNIADNPAANVYSIQVSAGGNIHRGRKRESQCNVDNGVYIDMLQDADNNGNLDPKLMDCVAPGTGVVPPATLAAWKGSVKAEIQNIAIPEPDIIKPGEGIFWQNADLRIVLNLKGAVPVFEARNATGTVNPALTAQLAAFMNDVDFNQGAGGEGPSSLRGTYPIFYTDVPVDCGNNVDRTCYSPDFASTDRIYTSDMVGHDNPIVAAGGVRDFRRGGFYNQREKKWMRLLNVNVADLILWNQQNGEPFFSTTDRSDGGLVLFVTIDGPSTSNGINNYGVRVFGSANLPIPGGIGVVADPTGITVVSDQAMYVLGDYNRGPINPGDFPRQPAAFLGDSVNVLSSNYWRPATGSGSCSDPCNYNDRQSNRGLGHSTRNAATTWINAAFLGGVDTTIPIGAAGYNGGLENYPRFHEDWGGGRALNYQGSFVSLGEPEHVSGSWCGTGNGCNIYNPPVRNWNFDPAFNDAANLPPLTPRFVYVQQVLFTEDFK